MSKHVRKRSLTNEPPAESAAIVVCEPAPRWAIAARQALGPAAKIVETRSLDDTWQQLAAAPHGVLLVEVETRRAPQLIALLLRVQTELPHVMTIACADRASVTWELLLQEAGAAIVLRAPRRLLAIRPWVLRHLARAPRPKLPLRERLRSRLPWPEVARSWPVAGG